MAAARSLPGGDDVGDLSPRPDTLAPPPCPGGRREGGGRAPPARWRRCWRLIPAPRHPGSSPLPGGRKGGGGRVPPARRQRCWRLIPAPRHPGSSPLPGGRREGGGGALPARRQRCWRLIPAPWHPGSSPLSRGRSGGGSASFGRVEGRQFAQRVVVEGCVGGRRRGSSECALASPPRRGFAAGDGAFETAGDGFVRLSHLFGRVESAITVFNAAVRAHVFQPIPSNLEIRFLNLHQWCGMPCWRL